MAPLPIDERDYLFALRGYEVLDTSPEESFDRLTRLAAHLFGIPIAVVSLVDETRQRIKFTFGLDDFIAKPISQNELRAIGVAVPCVG